MIKKRTLNRGAPQEVGRPNWHPVMGDFRQDPEGNWWYHVIGKGNKAGKIAVRD